MDEEASTPPETSRALCVIRRAEDTDHDTSWHDYTAAQDYSPDRGHAPTPRGFPYAPTRGANPAGQGRNVGEPQS